MECDRNNYHSSITGKSPASKLRDHPQALPSEQISNTDVTTVAAASVAAVADAVTGSGGGDHGRHADEGEVARTLLRLHTRSSLAIGKSEVYPGSPPPLMTSASQETAMPTATATPSASQPAHGNIMSAHASPPIVPNAPTAQKLYVVNAPGHHQYAAPGPAHGGYVTFLSFPGGQHGQISVTGAPATVPQHACHDYSSSRAMYPADPDWTLAGRPAAMQHPLPTAPWTTTVVFPRPAPITTNNRSKNNSNGEYRRSSKASCKQPKCRVSSRQSREQRRRLSSSDTSGYHTPSVGSEFGLSEFGKPLLSPPLTESTHSIDISPQSPATSSCDEEQIVVVDEDFTDDEDESFCASPNSDDVVQQDGVGDTKKFICNVCCDAFSCMSELRLHHREQHVQKRPFKCDLCDKSFQHPYSLRVHRRSQHNDVSACSMFPCEHCTREFASAASLRVHARMHTGERPYQCHTCLKTFMRSHQLKMHERIHTGTKPHACKICGKSFTQFKYLKEHCQRHAGYLPHECSVCKKRFLRPSHLKKHMRVHSGECEGSGSSSSCPISTCVFQAQSDLQR
eukprot:scpid59920/ scgid2979/ Zinc finger protein 28 homolog; Krueppel-like zinc finger factor X6